MITHWFWSGLVNVGPAGLNEPIIRSVWDAGAIIHSRWSAGGSGYDLKVKLKTIENN